MSRFIGVDLHKKSFTVSFYDSDKDKHSVRSFKMGELEEFKKRLCKEDVLGVEMTENTRYFREQISGFVKDVKVINPLRFSVISKSVKKTDKHDAKIIAKLLIKEVIPEIKMKDNKIYRIYSLCQTRDKLVKSRTTLKNKIHSLMNTEGIVLEKKQLTSNKYLDNLQKFKLDHITKVILDELVKQIKHLNEGIKRLDKELIEQGKKMNGHKQITSIPGIGDRSGTILLSTIDDINRFDSQKKLASYFGIVPIVRQSADKEIHGHITKHGSRLGRTTLVQCTLVNIRYSNYLRTYYEKKKRMKGSGKAIIATAHKLLDIIYETLKNNRVFVDFQNYKYITA